MDETELVIVEDNILVVEKLLDTSMQQLVGHNLENLSALQQSHSLEALDS